MKKTKLLSSLVLLTSGVGFAAPLITSCNKGQVNITPVIDEETTQQFESIKSNCVFNKESTIEFTCKQDQELDGNSVELRVNGRKLEAIKDYRVVGNKITIYYYALDNTVLTVKANAKNKHIIDKIVPSWVNKPFMVDDKMTSSDIKVTLMYKDGESEVLPWGDQGYYIYQVEDGRKKEIKNFDTTPFVFKELSYSYSFEIVLAKDPNVNILVKNIIIDYPDEETFLLKYKQCLKNFEKTIGKYGWISIDPDSKIMGSSDLASASITYNREEPFTAYANWKNESGEPLVVTSQVPSVPIGGISYSHMEDFLNEYDVWSTDYVKQFFNYGDTFGFDIYHSQETEKGVRIEFDKNTYFTNWRNTFEDESEPFKGTNIKNIAYKNYAKTAKVTLSKSNESPVDDSWDIYDDSITTQKKYFINENDNSFIVKAKTKTNPGETRYGKFEVYSDLNKIYTSDLVQLNKDTEVSTKITISDWDKIEHDSILTVKFNTVKQVKITDATGFEEAGDANTQFLDSSDTQYEGAGKKIRFAWYSKKETLTKNGTYYLTNPNAEVIASSKFEEFTGAQEKQHTVEFEITELGWAMISEKKIEQLSLKFETAKTVTFEAGSTFTTRYAPTITQKAFTQTVTPTVVKVTWETALTEDTLFGVNDKDGNTLLTLNLKAGAKELEFTFDKWSEIATDSTLTIEIKVTSSVEITCLRKDLQEYDMGSIYYINLFRIFKYKPNGHAVLPENLYCRVKDFKQIQGPERTWKICEEGHNISPDLAYTGENYLLVQLWCPGESEVTPWAGDKFSFTLEIEYHDAESAKTFVFEDMTLEFIEKPDSTK